MNNIFGIALSSQLARIGIETGIIGVCLVVGFFIRSRGWKNSIVALSASGLAVAFLILSIVDDLAYWTNIGFNSPLTIFLIYNLAVIGFVFSLFGFFDNIHKAVPITTLAVSFTIIALPVLVIVLMANIP